MPSYNNMNISKSVNTLPSTDAYQHYSSLFASVESFAIQNPESALKFGFALVSLSSLQKRIKYRLFKLSLSKWKTRILKQKGKPLYYKYLLSESSINYKNSIRKFSNSIKNLALKKISECFIGIKYYVKNLKKSSLLQSLETIEGKARDIIGLGFFRIQDRARKSKERLRYVRERVLWTSMVLKNSKGYALKKAMRVWQIWTKSVISASKIHVFCQITKFKVIFI